MDDVRYSELLFLQELAKGAADSFQDPSGTRSKAIGLSAAMYVEMAAALVEDLYVRFDRGDVQLIVARLRGEMSPEVKPSYFQDYDWKSPRETVHNLVAGLHGQGVQRLRITYRGLRRIEELRDLLRRDRILEPFGVLLDKRYFSRDLDEALRLGSDIPVSVIYTDMDNFKVINADHGHAAGDVVMKAYLEAVQHNLGQLGTAYRGLGDETLCLILGQGHERAVEIAERVRKSVAALDCEHQGENLPKVTASLGVASTPPGSRTADIETLADDRNRKAKERGKNRVVAD